MGLVVGSSLAFAYFLGWQLGVPVAFLGSGSALLFYGVITHKKDRSPD